MDEDGDENTASQEEAEKEQQVEVIDPVCPLSSPVTKVSTIVEDMDEDTFSQEEAEKEQQVEVIDPVCPLSSPVTKVSLIR
jgi:4-hydroxy-3-methylbut-2-enyl diphosphate reductase IspH